MLNLIFSAAIGRIVLAATLLLFISGCSVTTLRCGVDADRSFVDLVNVPQDMAGSARYFSELCGFAYEDRE